MMKSFCLAFTAAFLVLSGGIAAQAKAKPETHVISIKDMKFNPDSLEVKAGDTIEWKNEDIVPHTVTSETKKFDSGAIQGDHSWKYKAKKRGEFPYGCSFHPTMKAKLTVK
jgi:plastocyanin